MRAVRIVIFAKAPAPGHAKTRLIPALGAGGAASLARRMLETTLAEACASGVGPVELCASPPIGDPLWQSVSLPPEVEVTAQGEGDLGARMGRAAARAIARGEPVVLIGTDAPGLDAARLRQAATLLEEADATLFPVADGGYILLGLNRFDSTLFDGVAWGTGSVAEETLNRIDRLGWSVRVGPTLHDIDGPDDLRLLDSLQPR